MGHFRPFLTLVSAVTLVVAATLAVGGCGLIGGDDPEQAGSSTTTATFDPNVPATLDANTTTSISSTTLATDNTDPTLDPVALDDQYRLQRPGGIVTTVASNLGALARANAAIAGGGAPSSAGVVEVGPRFVVVVDGRSIQAYGPDGSADDTAAITIAELVGRDLGAGQGQVDPGAVRVVDVVAVDDGFLLFATGHGGEAKLLAPIWRSVDGADWTLVDATVTDRAARPRSPARSAATQTFNVPPADGRSGFTDVAVMGDGGADGEQGGGVVAAGWATRDGLKPEAVLWASTNGVDWTIIDLPGADEPNPSTAAAVGEGGSILVASVLRGGGDGPFAVGSNGGDIGALPFPTPGATVTGVAADDTAAYVLEYDLTAATNRLHRSENLNDWEPISLPDDEAAILADQAGEWQIEASAGHDPVVWVDTRTAGNPPGYASLWTWVDGSWNRTEPEGESVVSVGPDLIATVSGPDLVVTNRVLS